MGPTTEEDVPLPHPRKQSVTGTSPLRAGSGAPTTFFLKSEEEMNKDLSKTEPSPAEASIPAVHDSSYGVQSLEDALGSALLDHSSDAADKTGTTTTNNSSTAPGTTVLGKRKSLKNPVHPKIVAAAQRIIAPDSPSSSPSSSSRPASTTSPASSPSQKSGGNEGSSARRASPVSLSQPLTPLGLSPSPTPGGSGLPSTPKTGSLRSLPLSDEDEESVREEVDSQAVESGNEEDEQEDGGGEQSLLVTEKAPQLVMPSIKMPTRRPFTERGKQVGKLKILVAGAAGSGKTSMIRSILQCCEDIVHVDPLPTSQSSSQTSDEKSPKLHQSRESNTHHPAFTEIYASTRPYPPWWTDLEESRTLRRRKSMGDVVLDRNICFIDAPGYDSSSATPTSAEPTIKYIDHLLHRNAALKNLTEAELLQIFGGNGGVQVDVVLYVISSEGHNATDTDMLSRLCSLTNVIPIIGKADSVKPEDAVSLKTQLLRDLTEADVRPFLFGKTIEDCVKEPSQSPPFLVSSATGSDAENMDASLLMSSEYMQPLLPSELYSLVDHLFHPENAAWLRHLAARKFLQWRSTRDGKSMLMNRMPTPRSGKTNFETDPNKPISGIASPDLALSPTLSQAVLPHSSSRSVSPSVSSSSGERQSLFKFVNRIRGEEQLGQVRLAKWATDLQRSLKNERERYERLAQGERHRGSVHRLEEYKAEASAEQDQQLVRTKEAPNRRRVGRLPRGPIKDPSDPLGLLGFADRVGQNGWVVVQVLGGCGVASALLVWVWRSWASHSVSTWDSWFSNVGLDNWSAWSFVER
ncbi:MAG: hypothetical protein M1822_006423 [Bathelium mastoideum]|nr:MAG: hypothetical protein M1822_006423 [Bathelium mastoideum]